MQKEKIFIFLSFLTTFIFLASFVVYAWQEPTSNPPGGNVYAPVNVGPTSQTKTGNLTLKNLYLNATAAEGDIYKIDELVGYNDIFVKGNSSETAPVYLAGNKIYVYTNSQPRLFVDTNGNVGIGTTNPQYKLHVQGKIQATGDICTNQGGGICLSEAGAGNISGSGTTNYIPKWTGSRSLGNSVIYQSGSNIGIGTTSPGSYKLYINGNVAVSSGHGYFYASDQSFKTNIRPLKNSLNKILKLQGVSFKWKNTGEPSIGLIAQDVEKVFPEVVFGKEGEKTIDYAKLVAPLIEALKEQQEEIEELKAEIEQLKLKIK